MIAPLRDSRAHRLSGAVLLRAAAALLSATAPVRPRRYELPLRIHQLIDTSIRDTFQDELFTHPGAEKDGEERNDTDDEGAGADE